jgi:hypothetical protein
MMRHQSEEAAKLKYPGGEVTTTFSAVAYGECSGRKMLLRMTRPAAWMEVEYLLAVPGGFVCVSLGTVTGADFR